MIGGVPAGGLNFGAAINAQAIIDQPYQFDFYDGGGLDVAFLGLAQADAEGNVNVSKFGPRLAGAGGFINISQSAQKVVFVGTFTAGACEVAVADGGLLIVRDGRRASSSPRSSTAPSRAAMPPPAARTCSTSPSAACSGCAPEGLELVEIAPGVDLERDILARMDFRPIVAGPLTTMDARIFRTEPMGLREQLLAIRSTPASSTTRPATSSSSTSSASRCNRSRRSRRSGARCAAICEPLGRRVHAVVNYEGFVLDRDVEDAWADMVSEVVERWYDGVTRYTTSAFLRAKLGDALARPKLAPHIFESEEEALAHSRRLRQGPAPDNDK